MLITFIHFIHFISPISIPAGEQIVIELLRQWLNGRLRADSFARIDTISGSPANQQLLRNLDLRVWLGAMRCAQS